MFKSISILVLSVFITTFAFAGDTTSLVGAWLMDAATNANEPDQSGLANTLTDNSGNVPSVTGQIGSAREMNATGEKFTRADDSDFDFTGDFSVMLWFNVADTGNNNRAFIAKSNTSPSNGWGLWKNFDETLRFYIASTVSSGTSTTAISLSTNMHIAAVFSDSGNTVTFYRDGSGTSEAISNTASPADTTEVLTVGDNAHAHPDGWFDEIVIFGRAVTGAEIDDIKNNGIAAFIAGTSEAPGIGVSGVFQLFCIMWQDFNYYNLVNQHRTKFGIERPLWMQFMSNIGLFKNKVHK